MTSKINFNPSSKYPFDLDKVLYAAQDFRWCKWDDEWHSGVLAGNLIHIRQVDNALEYKSHSGADLDDILRTYFRLDDPIDRIYDELSSVDGKLCELVNDYPWMRVLRQPDPWECLVAYICAGHSKIEHTAQRVSRIAKRLGCRVELGDDVRYTFPTWDEVLSAGEGPLQKLRLRFPKKHSAAIVAAARRIDAGKLNLSFLAQPTVCYAEARWRLKGCYSIDDKTADCISLFALDKTEAFPLDVWVSRAVADYFPGQEDLVYDEVVWKARDLFGEYAGYANQFLFHDQFEMSRQSPGAS